MIVSNATQTPEALSAPDNGAAQAADADYRPARFN